MSLFFSIRYANGLHIHSQGKSKKINCAFQGKNLISACYYMCDTGDEAGVDLQMDLIMKQF